MTRETNEAAALALVASMVVVTVLAEVVLVLGVAVLVASCGKARTALCGASFRLLRSSIDLP